MKSRGLFWIASVAAAFALSLVLDAGWLVGLSLRALGAVADAAGRIIAYALR